MCSGAPAPACAGAASFPGRGGGVAGQAGAGRAHSRCQQARKASFQGQVRLSLRTRARAWRTSRAGSAHQPGAQRVRLGVFEVVAVVQAEQPAPGGQVGGEVGGQHPPAVHHPGLTWVLPANAAWLTCAAIAHNLLRAAGSLASLSYGKARGASIRRDLIDVAARTARHGRGNITLHLPEGWHREHEWMTRSRPPAGHRWQRPDPPVPGHRTLNGLVGHPGPRPPAQMPGQAAEQVSGKPALPLSRSENESSVTAA